MSFLIFGKQAGKDRSAWIDCLLLALVTFLPYAQVATHQFVELDDSVYVHSNAHIIAGLSWDSAVWAFSTLDQTVGNWHPVTWLSILVDREMFGPYVGGYLLMNVGWHIGAVCSCYLAFRSLTDRRFWGLMIASVFALHPANVENVAWYSERKSILDAFFWFWGVWAYVACLRTGKRVWLGVVMITHLLGLMSKPMHVTFPCTLVLIEVMYRDFRGTLNGFWIAILQATRRVWPLFLCSLYGAYITLLAQAKAIHSAEIFPLDARLINIAISYADYLRMFFIPDEFSPFYPLFIEDLTWTRAVAPLIFLCGVSLLLLLSVKRTPVLLCGWLWFLGTMIPAVGVVHVGAQSHADRYLYIPMLGLAFLFPWLVDRLPSLSRMARVWGQTSILLLAGFSLAIQTYFQVGYWRNGIVLYKHAWDVSGRCMMILQLRLIAYLNDGRYADGVALAQEQLRTMKSPTKRASILSVYAKLLIGVGDDEGAINALRELIRLLDSGNGYAGDREPLIMLASMLVARGDLDGARRLLPEAMRASASAAQSDLARTREASALRAIEEAVKKPQP